MLRFIGILAAIAGLIMLVCGNVFGLLVMAIALPLSARRSRAGSDPKL